MMPLVRAVKYGWVIHTSPGGCKCDFSGRSYCWMNISIGTTGHSFGVYHKLNINTKIRYF